MRILTRILSRRLTLPRSPMSVLRMCRKAPGIIWVIRAVQTGLFSSDDGSLPPNGKATRAQCAKMVSVFYDTFVVTD